MCSLAQPTSQTAFNNSKYNSVSLDLGLDQIRIFRLGGLKYSYYDQCHETSSSSILFHSPNRLLLLSCIVELTFN